MYEKVSMSYCLMGRMARYSIWVPFIVHRQLGSQACVTYKGQPAANTVKGGHSHVERQIPECQMVFRHFRQIPSFLKMFVAINLGLSELI